MNQTITNAHPAKADASVSWFDTLASGVDLTMDRMWLTNVAAVFSARAATAEHA
jgi:hypothetical protein